MCGPGRKLLVWSRRALKVNRLLRTLKLNKLTFLKSQPTLPVRDVTHHLVPVPIWDFYFDISEWHILPARVWTSALVLHLTNLCAKWKVLSLTKPKGKIYKMKSLGHYITDVRFCKIKFNLSNQWISKVVIYTAFLFIYLFFCFKVA